MPTSHDPIRDMEIVPDTIYHFTIKLNNDADFGAAIKRTIDDKWPAVGQFLGITGEEVVIRNVPMEFKDEIEATIEKLMDKFTSEQRIEDEQEGSTMSIQSMLIKTAKTINEE